MPVVENKLYRKKFQNFCLVVFVKLRREVNVGSNMLVNTVVNSLPNVWAQTQDWQYRL